MHLQITVLFVLYLNFIPRKSYYVHLCPASFTQYVDPFLCWLAVAFSFALLHCIPVYKNNLRSCRLIFVLCPNWGSDEHAMSILIHVPWNTSCTSLGYTLGSGSAGSQGYITVFNFTT